MPFPWLPKRNGSSSKFDFLKELGVLARGVWIRECGPAKPFGSDAPLLKSLWRNKIIKSGGTGASGVEVTLERATLAEKLEDLNWWVGDKNGKKLLTTSLPKYSSSIDSWESYCAERPLPVTSILPTVLDQPLTVYWAVRKLKEKLGGSLPRQINIVIAGVEKEMDQWPVFLELGALLPENDINLHFVGPEIPSWADNCSVIVPHIPTATATAAATTSSASTEGPAPSASTPSTENEKKHYTKLHFHAQLLQNVLDSRLQAKENLPDIVVGLNAGLGAYPTWLMSLFVVVNNYMHRSERKPKVLYFTDYIAESTYVSRTNCNMMLGATVKVSETEINPFRKPCWVKQPTSNMPYASNGFGFWIEHKN
jgi:hypothetical protein